MKPIRFAVVGAGRRAALGIRAHRPENQTYLVAAVDNDEEALKAYASRFEGELDLSTDYAATLARTDIDAVLIFSPDYLHEDHTVQALEAGKTVFVEKPLAISIEGCDRILRTAEKHGNKLYVGHNMRFFPVMQKLKDIASSGEIGEVQSIWVRHFISYGGDAYYKDWHSERQYAHSLLLQKGAHDIDMIHWFANSHTARVVGMGRLSVYDRTQNRRSPDTKGIAAFNRDNWPPLKQTGMSPVIDVEDHNMLLLQMENGIQASYVQCHYTPDDHRNYTIIGTEGRVENCGDHSSFEKQATIRLWKYRCGYNENGTESFSIPSIEGSHGGSDPRIIADFFHFCRTGENLGASPYDARMSVAAGYLGAESLRQNSIPFTIPPVS